MKLYCFAHSQYDGSQPPILSCKNCCNIFIAAIKRRSQAGQEQFSAYKWLEDKAREVQGSLRADQAKASSGTQSK